MGASDNDSLLGSSPGGGGLIPPAPIVLLLSVLSGVLN